MIFFTWNLRRTERAFRLALTHLAGLSDEFVATFQELPKAVSSLKQALSFTSLLTNNAVQCLGVVGSEVSPGRVALFSSAGVSAIQPIKGDPNKRIVMRALRSNAWSDLLVAGFHAVDRRNVPNDFGRGGWAQLSRQVIERFWNANRPLVMMGDFNADPYHPEVSARMGIFAVRDRREARRDWESPTIAGPMRPLYNPMWHLLPEDPTGPRGTYKLKSHDQGIRWRLCDQILVSRELIDKLVGNPKILSVLANTNLTTQSGTPIKKISDHLPVQLSVSL